MTAEEAMVAAYDDYARNVRWVNQCAEKAEQAAQELGVAVAEMNASWERAVDRFPTLTKGEPDISQVAQ